MDESNDKLHVYIVTTEAMLIRRYRVRAASKWDAEEMLEAGRLGEPVQEDTDGEEVSGVWRVREET